MNEWKEVWYVWDGGRKGEKYKMSDGSILSYEKIGGAIMQTGSNEILNHIHCYTLGQKRRRLKCACCGGSGFNNDVFNELGIESDCVVCQGTGFIKGEWEYQEC